MSNQPDLSKLFQSPNEPAQAPAFGLRSAQLRRHARWLQLAARSLLLTAILALLALAQEPLIALADAFNLQVHAAGERASGLLSQSRAMLLPLNGVLALLADYALYIIAAVFTVIVVLVNRQQS